MMTFEAARQACLAIMLTGAPVAAQTAPPYAEGLPEIADELARLAAERSQSVHDAVLTGLEACLAEDVQPRLSKRAVGTVIVNLHLLYFRLVSERIGEAERRQELADSIATVSKTLAPADRESLRVLRHQSLEQGLTLLCVAATARGILESAADHSSDPR